jgi:hypothetical protein
MNDLAFMNNEFDINSYAATCSTNKQEIVSNVKGREERYAATKPDISLFLTLFKSEMSYKVCK